MGFRVFSLTLGGLLLAAASDSFAANGAAPPGASDAAAGASAPVQVEQNDNELEAVIVTAQKRSENLQQVPITVEAFTAKDLQTFKITTVTDLAQYVAGFDLISTAGQSYPFIRGLGIGGASGPWQEAGVSTYIDGVYYESSNSSQAVLNNLAGLEVDKGPQGTLYGRNTIGGLINYRTVDPSHTPQLDVNVGYGNYDTWTGRLYGTGGITDNLAANIAIAVEDQKDGWGHDLYTGGEAHTSNAYAVRSKWVLVPGDSTKVTWIVDDNRANSPEEGLGLTRGQYPFITTGPIHPGGFYDIYNPTPPKAQFTDYGASMKVEQDLQWAQLMSITAVRHDTEIKNTAYGFNIPYLPETPAVGQVNGNKINGLAHIFDSTTTQELQLLSPDASRIKWVAGAFVLFNNTGNIGSVNDKTVLPTGSQNVITTDGQKTKSYSGFAQATVPIIDDTNATAGVRFTSDHRSVYGGSAQNTVANQNVYTPVASLSAAANPEPSVTSNKPTFKAGLDHHFAENLLTYFSFSTGFQSAYYSISGGANPPPLQPQTIKNYEVGLKSDLLDNRLRVDASVFRYDLTNAIVSQHINGVTVSSNAAAARATGTDVDLTFRPIRSLTLGASFEYVDPKYTSYDNAVAYVPNASGAWNTATVDATGAQVQFTEKFMGTANASYVITSDQGDFNVVGALTYHSGIQFDTQALQVQPSYTLLNGSVGWTPPVAKQWDVKVWGKNLTNRKYVTTFLTNNVVMMYSPAAPLTFGIEVGYHFGL